MPDSVKDKLSKRKERGDSFIDPMAKAVDILTETDPEIKQRAKLRFKLLRK